MYGIIIAFKDYMPSLGIMGSPWVGFKHFQRFFDSYYFWELIKNTLGISIYSLVVGFPLPIILALALMRSKTARLKITQTVTYAPNFIAVVVMVGMVILISLNRDHKSPIRIFGFRADQLYDQSPLV